MRVFLLALALASSPLAAQPRVVPLGDALRLAHAQALDVLRAEAGVQAAQIDVDAVRARRWPALSLDVGGGQRYGLAFDQTSGGLTQQTVESADVGLSAGAVVFDGGARRAEARAAGAGLRAAEWVRARALQEASASVLAGVLAAALAEADRRVALEDEAAQLDLLAEVEAQVAAGERARADALQQAERVAAARLAGLAAERAGALAEARLVRELDLDPAGSYRFPVPDDEPDDGSGEPDAALVARALARRPDVQAADAAVRAADADRQAAGAARLPRLAAGAFVGTSYTSAAVAGLPGQLADNRGGGLRLSVSVPVLDRGAARAGVRRADARAALLRAEADDLRRAVGLDVRERRIARDALRAEATAADVRVQAAEAALGAERARFAGGAATLASVSLAQARVAEARGARERLRVLARVEARRLALAVGA